MKRSWQSILFICVTAILSAVTYDGLYSQSSVSRLDTYTSDLYTVGQQGPGAHLDLPSGPTYLTVSHRHSGLPFRYYKRYMEVGHFVPVLPSQFSVSTPSFTLVPSRTFCTQDQDLHYGIDAHALSRGPPVLG